MEKVYKIYDNWKKEEVFEGTFEDYKKYVIDNWNECKESFEEKDFSEELEDGYMTAVWLAETKKDFIELFDSLEYRNLNVFGDCVDLEVRDEEGNFLYKR